MKHFGYGYDFDRRALQEGEPAFGAPVVGVSLLAACRMRFQRRTSDARLLYELELDPWSGYVLAEAARWSWQHSIPAVPDLRYSVTFRTLREPAT